MDRENVEKRVRACYSTWNSTYYSDHYGEKAAYPPVHVGLVRSLLVDAKAQSVLDAGCGPASLVRELAKHGFDLYGFDLTPEMVAEARKVMEDLGTPSDHFWEGSVLSARSFRSSIESHPRVFDAALCTGVLPHIPEEADEQVIENLRNAVRPDGLVVLEARNQLFSLFTLNRYSYQFFLEELIRPEKLKKSDTQDHEINEVMDLLKEQFRMDLPPIRQGKAGEPGYDEILSRSHNPLVLKEQFASSGFNNVRLLFYHYHCLPPMFESQALDLFRRESLGLENPTDWRGYFMASAFLIAGNRC